MIAGKIEMTPEVMAKINTPAANANEQQHADARGDCKRTHTRAQLQISGNIAPEIR